MIDQIVALFIICILVFAAKREKLLKTSGAWAAVFVGFAIYIGAGIKGFLLLVLFFITSSFWSKYKSERKKSVNEIVAKGDQRDWAQVIANGGVPALCSLLYFFQGDFLWIVAFAISLACSNADTWASEIGVLSKKDPILIFPFIKVKKGTSGAVSVLGTWAGVLGAGTIAVFAKLLWFREITFDTIIIIIIFGTIGMFIDTILGRTLQIKYSCKICQIETEKKVHCEDTTNFIKGIPFMNNDSVNFFSVLLPTLVSVVLLKVL